MENNHAFLTPFNYFKWMTEIVIYLRLKVLYRVTMGNETETNSVVEKSKYFNRVDEAFRILCLSISRDIRFHVGNITTHNGF